LTRRLRIAQCPFRFATIPGQRSICGKVYSPA
jgi:hypothetical protein